MPELLSDAWDLPPMVKWTAAVIAGGGVAGLTQGVTAMLRANSTVFTGGIGNVVLSTLELGGALLVSLLALAARSLHSRWSSYFCG